MKGIKAAAAVGIIAGDPDKELQVIANVTAEQKAETERFLATTPITVKHVNCQEQLDVTIIEYKGEHHADVRISGFHTNIVTIQRDDEVLFRCESMNRPNQKLTDRSCLSIAGIVDFADSLDINDIKDIIGRQLAYNKAISDEGLKNNWGANIGKTLLKEYGNDVKIRSKARAAAGSDARMNGCELPVVINSGSGNQGLTVSMPVLTYAEEYNIDEDRLYRAVVVSNLTAIHQKKYIGPLSAYCGAVSASAGASAGIAYLMGGGEAEIAKAVSNTLAMVGGIVCDGAKASCAAKISSSLEAAILAMEMSLEEKTSFQGGDGLVKDDIEKTIRAFGKMGKEGMRETDREILTLMMED